MKYMNLFKANIVQEYVDFGLGNIEVTVEGIISKRCLALIVKNKSFVSLWNWRHGTCFSFGNNVIKMKREADQTTKAKSALPKNTGVTIY
jgi:hypothetical protein